MTYIITPSMENIRRDMWHHAKSDVWAGDGVFSRYFNRARRRHNPTGTSLLFTRDQGYHSSGWFKNPDYERCYHLSITFFDPETGQEAPFSHPMAETWVKLFFGDWSRYVWTEPGDYGAHEVYHYRVFCDPGWQPIKPRGEVYNTELTELGWLSYSDLKYEREKERRAYE